MDRAVIEMDVQLIWPTFHLHTDGIRDRGHFPSFSTIVAWTPEIDSLSFFSSVQEGETTTSIRTSRERELSRAGFVSRKPRLP